jgi:hypothetical protein
MPLTASLVSLIHTHAQTASATATPQPAAFGNPFRRKNITWNMPPPLLTRHPNPITDY